MDAPGGCQSESLSTIRWTIRSGTFLDGMDGFSGKTIAQLREVAIDARSKSEDAVITELIAEMETRIKRRQQQGKPPKRDQQAFLEELRAGQIAPPKRVPIKIAEPESRDDELARLRRELELWRSLYSHDTETLTRWGMTDSLPIEMVEEVLRLWEELINQGPADLVRTKDRFASDAARIKARAARKS